MSNIKMARALRRNATIAEQHLWRLLRHRQMQGAKFRRQHPVGPFIADFACVDARIIIEADGGRHNGDVTDMRRDLWLAAHGWQVLRFWNNDILGNSDGVLAVIAAAVGLFPPHPAPPHPTLSP